MAGVTNRKQDHDEYRELGDGCSFGGRRTHYERGSGPMKAKSPKLQMVALFAKSPQNL